MTVPVTVKDELLREAAPVNAFLERCLDGLSIPEKLGDSMRYSLLVGGKRLRPVLTVSFAELFGAKSEDVMPFAAGWELIHTYSLVHDDLPAMDDDDLRRGKPSNHKVYGEDVAILAGDGLLTEAFGLMLSCENVEPRRLVQAGRYAAHAAGAAGMVGGQALDMEYTGRDGIGLDALREMHAMKTGAIIKAACVCGAVLATDDDASIGRAREYGAAIGVAFQIVDDILDVIGDEATLGKPVGSDEGQGKTTYPALLGLEESRRLAEEYVGAACDALAGLDHPKAGFLTRLARYIVDRVQ
jgi:geranylgeranyl diphosphate synthase type II